jgi:vitamin B12 transporter
MNRLILLLLLSPLHLLAQTKISGTISDKEGKPIPGANVFIKDTYDGSSTDPDGKFSFVTDETGEHVFSASFLGFESYEQKLKLEGKEITIKISLKEKSTELNTVTISAGSFEASDEKKMVILKPLDIVTTAGANGDVYGALQTLPGTQQIGEKEGLYVRGGDASETKTIIDGISVDNPYFTSVPDVPQRGRFSPFLFKGTSFSTGGYSAQYGQALSSALILETQDVVEQTGTNLGIMSVGLSAGHNIAFKKSSLGFYAGHTNLKPYMSIINQHRDWTHAPEASSGSFVYRLKTSTTGLLKTFVNYGHNALALNLDNIEDPMGEIKNSFSLSNDNWIGNASYKEIIAKKWNLFSAFSFSDNRDNIHLDTIPIKNHNSLYQGRVTLSRGIGQLSIIRFGGEFQRPDINEKYSVYSHIYRENFGAGFVEGDVYLTQKLVTRTGVRYEFSDVLEKSNIAPRVSLAYKTGKYSQFSVAYGDFFQTPEKNFLFRNPELDYEKATHYIFNYQVVSEKRTFRVEAYYKKYNQLVKEIPISTPLSSDTVFTNGGDGFAQGFDIFWRDKKTFRYGDYWISYSYLDTKRNYRNFPISATPTFAATHTFSIVYKYFFPKLNLQPGFTYAYNSGRPYYNPNRPYSEFLTDYAKPYHNLSINANYLTSIFNSFAVVVFSVTNVLGINNVFSYRYSSDGTRREEVGPTSARFIFIGTFINIGSKKDDSDKYN